MNLSQRDPPRAFTAAARRAAPLPASPLPPYVHRSPDHVRRAAQAARVRSIRETWERIAVDEKMEKNTVCEMCVYQF